jgi:ABC-type glycerol-3-phosphate transport system substrate-binding protein
MLATGVAAITAAGFVAGCGGGERQDAHEPSGTFKVKVLKASFPLQQRLAGEAVMRVVVRNDSGKTIPNVAVTVTSDDDAKGGAGFTTRSSDTALADPTRQLWIVDQGPRGGDTAYVSTWALGPLAAGRTQSFVWHVTPVVAGTHMLRWHVAAGLNGKAVARTASGQDPAGTFRVNVSSKPPAVTVDPKTGDVVNSSS